MLENDYMSTDAERAKQPEALQAMQQMSTAPGASESDVAVFNAMWSFWNFAHVFDDLIDERADWDADRKARAFKALHDFVVDLLLNPFVRAHAAELRALYVSAMTRCLDGDAMEAKALEGRDKEGCAAAAVVRCGDVDVLMHMAYLHGGWEHLRRWSALREYDKTERKE